MKKDVDLTVFLNHLFKISDNFQVSYQDFKMGILVTNTHDKVSKETLKELEIERKIQRDIKAIEKAKLILSKEYQDSLNENFKKSINSIL